VLEAKQHERATRFPMLVGDRSPLRPVRSATLALVPTDSLTQLATHIAQGLPGPTGGTRPLIDALFGDRYQKRHHRATAVRDAYALADGEEGVPYAGLINPDNPPSGPYGGTSVVWFPTRDSGSLIHFGIGTRGLAPDEGILTRPGHKRRITALRRHLARQGVETWVKQDPSALGASVPKTVRDRYPGFEHVFKRYGAELYACAAVPTDPAVARAVVQAFVDLYAYERGWQVMKQYEEEYNSFHAKLRDDLFAVPMAREVHNLLRTRRFVVLQGPPGTGKTRMSDEIRRTFFDGRGMTVQFHPAVTYEDFVVGLSPDAKDRNLRFDVRPGWLLEAARAAKEGPFLLVIDEINRADLGRVLGEAIYLFEAAEVGGKNARRVRLPHSVDGASELALPENLFVLATMNTADRSIASMDLAVRRRFAFVTMPPERAAVAAQGVAAATAAFDQVANVFVEHAPGDALQLMPGHAYFLVKDERELRDRLRFEVIPLLDEYLQQGLLGPASHELGAVRDALEDMTSAHGDAQ
jgi:5-methylcytosine-specific restriction protein B